jgi:hypothetical protein
MSLCLLLKLSLLIEASQTTIKIKHFCYTYRLAQRVSLDVHSISYVIVSLFSSRI